MEQSKKKKDKIWEKLESIFTTSMSKNKQNERRLRQLELLKEFSHQVGDFYEEKRVGDNWYVKQYNGNSDTWQVAIFSNNSFRRYKTYTKATEEELEEENDTMRLL